MDEEALAETKFFKNFVEKAVADAIKSFFLVNKQKGSFLIIFVNQIYDIPNDMNIVTNGSTIHRSLRLVYNWR